MTAKFDLVEIRRMIEKLYNGLSSNRCNSFYINPKKFWDQLQLVIGTEEDVHIRREVNALYVYAFCSPSCREYLSGSKGEGFLFPWSDLDIMVSKLPPEEISMASFHNDCAYIATTDGSQPGFCKLIQCNAKCDYYSRVEFLQLKQHAGFNVNFDQTIRGPSYSTNFPDGFDCCYALPVHPDSSNVFLKTYETKFWNDLKLAIMNKNITVMHCVPKGPEKGDDDGHQWRIIQENLLDVLQCENALMYYIICKQVPSEKNGLQNESHMVRTFYSLCLALKVVNGHQTTYRECINSVLKIMVALQGEENQLRNAILKYLWLLIMRRIGVIMYDKFVLTGFESYLLSAEVALMFAQHANIFGSIYFATFGIVKEDISSALSWFLKLEKIYQPVFLKHLCI